MTPDCERAAIKATETLIKFGIRTAPVDPLPILKQYPNVFVMTFAEASDKMNMDRQELLDLYGCENLDAVTNVYILGEKKHYIVTYNRLLPSRIVDMALARELGHIVLEHDGTRPEDVRQQEAKCFAHHLMAPRPLIHALIASDLRVTEDLFRNVTGFPDRCLCCLRKEPGVTVPAELNRIVLDNFRPYILNFFDYYRHASKYDGSALADLGHYMDNYQE